MPKYDDFYPTVTVEVELTVRVFHDDDPDMPLQAMQRTAIAYNPNEDIREEIRKAAVVHAEGLGAIAEPIAFSLSGARA